MIHLPREPVVADTPVIAHELTHTRSPLARPRFLLADHRHGDADEQATRRATSQAFTTSPGPTGANRAAPAIARLPVGGAAVLLARAPVADRPGGPATSSTPGTPPSPPVGSAVLARDTGQATSAGTEPSAISAAEPSSPAAVDYDRLIGYLDRWLARELERRGGRYQGVF